MVLVDFMMFIIGKMIFIIIVLLENQEQFQLIHGHGPRIKVICWLGLFYVSQLCVTGTGTVTIEWFRVVRLCPSFLKDSHHLMYDKNLTLA